MPIKGTRSSRQTNKSPSKSRKSLPATTPKSNDSDIASQQPGSSQTAPRRSRIIAAAKNRSKSVNKNKSRSKSSASKSPSRSTIKRKSTTTSKVFTKKESTASTSNSGAGGAKRASAKRRSERASSTASNASTTRAKKSASKSRQSLQIDTDNAQTRYALRRRTPAPTATSSSSSSPSSPSSKSTESKKKCPIGFFNSLNVCSRFGACACPLTWCQALFSKCHSNAKSNNKGTINSGYIRCTRCRFLQLCTVTILLVVSLSLINYFHLIDALEYKNIKDTVTSSFASCSAKVGEALASCQDKVKGVVDKLSGLVSSKTSSSSGGGGAS